MSEYQRYCTEIINASGALEEFSLTYPENFNVRYDVVDVIAIETPDKKALVWCNTKNEEHIFIFSDIKSNSKRLQVCRYR